MQPDRQRRAERAHRDPYRELFERSADAILIIEGDRFIDCNDATVEMLRYESKAELLQTHPSQLSPPTQPDGRDSYEKANEMIAIAFERGSHRFEWDHVRADGEVFPVEVLLTAVREPGRRILHVVWRDVTGRKLLEEQLRQAQKMEALGQLTGGIAHDFNNVLVSIIGHAHLLADQLDDRPVAMQHVDAIQLAGERAADLVRKLLAFGRKQQLLPTVLDLNELTLEMRPLLEQLVGEAVTLDLRPAPEGVRIRADRSQVEQVLLNLAANARDAMPEGGTLTIATARTSSPGAARELPPGEHAVLVVEDTGTGMDAETRERAVDPFFTTKETGKGSGLGLATVYGIVEQSKGSLVIESAPGAGTRVSVHLPLTVAPVLPSEPRRAPGAPRRAGGGTVLVAEDEEEVARLVRAALEARGYRVLTSANGREALDAYRRHHDEVDLLLTDVIMPEMGGPALVAALREAGHEPSVLFMSGYTDQRLSRLHELDREFDLLNKPFTVDELVERVQRGIERARGSRRGG